MVKNETSVTFVATFPSIGSAIKVSGDGSGMRVQLDIPENQMPDAIRLLAWRQKRLKVTIELDDDRPSAPRRRTLKG